jgi:hypothetical protein
MTLLDPGQAERLAVRVAILRPAFSRVGSLDDCVIVIALLGCAGLAWSAWWAPQRLRRLVDSAPDVRRRAQFESAMNKGWLSRMFQLAAIVSAAIAALGLVEIVSQAF